MFKVFDEGSCNFECAQLFGTELPSLFQTFGTLTEDKRGSLSTFLLYIKVRRRLWAHVGHVPPFRQCFVRA